MGVFTPLDQGNAHFPASSLAVSTIDIGNKTTNIIPATARAVIPRDTDVDNLNRQLHRELASYMVERPTTISRCLSLMVISKSLERVADHATNIAEEVVYLYEAVDIRHTAKK